MFNSESHRSISMVAVMLLSLSRFSSVQGQNFTILNDAQNLTGFKPCDALMAANLTHIVHMASSALYQVLVNGSWTTDTQRSPYCFAVPNTAAEVAQTVSALRTSGKGAGDWHVAIRSGGHGSDNQNSITNGVIIDMTHMNTTKYDAGTKIASIGTGARWGSVYTTLQDHGVLATGGRQSIVGVGGLLLGGGVGFHTPRRGFGCDGVVNYEMVTASGKIINANASSHPDLWRALKGGSSNFGLVTRFDVETFPAQNVTLERRSIGGDHADEFIDAMVGFADLDQTFHDNAMVSVISYQPDHGISMTVTEVNTANDANTTAFDAFNRIPVLTPSNRQSLTLADATAIDAPELNRAARNVGAGPRTIANDRRIVRYCFEEHQSIVADLNTTLGPKSFSTLLEFQPLAAYWSEIGAQKGGNMLGLDRNPRNKLYYALAVTLLVEDSIEQLPLVYQRLAAAIQRITKFAESIGGSEDFIYLPYADASQDPLGSYGAANVRHMKRVAKQYDPEGFFQRRVPGGFKIDRVV